MEVMIEADDESVTIGRSMEFPIDFETAINSEPISTLHTASVPSPCGDKKMKYTNKYKVLKIIFKNERLLFPLSVDGINAEGLSASALYLADYTQYPQEVPFELCDNAIPQSEVIDYIVGK